MFLWSSSEICRDKDVKGSSLTADADLLGDVRPPGVDLQAVAPAASPVQPRAVLVRHRSLSDPQGAAQSGTWGSNETTKVFSTLFFKAAWTF